MSGDIVVTSDRSTHVAKDHPFTPAQLTRIDEALTLSSRETGLLFSVYIGEMSGLSRDQAVRMFNKLAAEHDSPVLIAVSPGQRKLEIVTGGDSSRRVPNRICSLAALAMSASFSNGDLTGGIVNGLRQLADAAGPV